ncbi:hypothetical protein Taro_046866 [Colocasia esculenta]|uniref:CCHC-type domain-containing protein n=1 Tax=Colocasia esculenta TaxID=4460 RepID=A0A843WUT2_COLES|nr:hypothetical protein [Colocasia esculenta]
MNVETLLEQKGQDPIESWEEKKVKLREKYLPASFRHRLIDRWQNIFQGTCSVTEYIVEFDGYLMRCGAREESVVTLSRFRKGLRPIYQHELFRQHVTTIEHAYQVVCELEQFEPRADSLPQARPTYPRSTDQRMASGAPQRGPMVRSVEHARQDPPPRPQFLPPGDSTTTIPVPPIGTRPPQGTPSFRREDKGKASIMGESSRGVGSRDRCYKCQGIGHYAAQCPSKTLVVTDTISEDAPPEQYVTYEAGVDMAEEYQFEEEKAPQGAAKAAKAHARGAWARLDPLGIRNIPLRQQIQVGFQDWVQPDSSTQNPFFLACSRTSSGTPCQAHSPPAIAASFLRNAKQQPHALATVTRAPCASTVAGLPLPHPAASTCAANRVALVHEHPARPTCAARRQRPVRKSPSSRTPVSGAPSGAAEPLFAGLLPPARVAVQLPAPASHAPNRLDTAPAAYDQAP